MLRQCRRNSCYGSSLLAAGALCSAIGALCYAAAVARSSVLSRTVTRIVIVGFAVMALAWFIPLGVAQIVIGLAAVVALWPIGYRIWTSPMCMRPAGSSDRRLRPPRT